MLHTRLAELSQVVGRAIKELFLLDETFRCITEEMKRYEMKKNIAKTVGTTIGVAGAAVSIAGAFVTAGLSLLIGGGVTGGVGAVTNIVTDLIDRRECKLFVQKVQEQTENYTEIENEMNKILEEIGETANKLIEQHPDLDPSKALMVTLLTDKSVNLLEKKKISDVLLHGITASLTQCKILLTTMNFADDILVGLVKGVGAGAAGAGAGLRVLSVGTRTVSILGGVISVFEVL